MRSAEVGPWHFDTRACFRIIGLISAFIVGAVTPAFCRLTDLEKQNLPNTPAVMDVLQNIEAIEPMAENWQPKWNYSRPKKDIQKIAKAAFENLSQVLKADPNNSELYLFRGLVAHYGYNLEIEEYFKAAIKDYQQAGKLNPKDYRAQWFLSLHQIQSSHETDKGMLTLMDIAHSRPAAELPASFWKDYGLASQLTGMPSNAIWAHKNFIQLVPKGPASQNQLVWNLNLPKFAEPSWKNPMPKEELWSMRPSQDNMIFTNRLFGMSITVPGTWQVTAPDAKNQNSAFMIMPPAYSGKKGELSVTIALMASLASPGSSLKSNLAKLTYGKKINRFTGKLTLTLPKGSLIYEDKDKEIYAPEGGAHILYLTYSKPEPENPGLALESPVPLPGEKGDGVKYFRPLEAFARARGEIYYLWILDTAESIFNQALPDFEKIIAKTVVE